MPSSLNDNQKRRLLLSLEHVDRLLDDALHMLVPEKISSPFQRLVPDSVPVQRKVIADYLAQLRGVMVRILESQNIAIPAPRVSSLWSFQTAILSAEVAVEELAPKYMSGYGQLSDEAVHELELVTTQLTDVLDRMRDFLTRRAGQDLQARLARLEKTTREVETAQLLEQVITARGLVELRPSLDTVTERLEGTHFEIGVFGRVSSGKSSLLDHILKTSALPVGVTPVTAIPTRVVFGPQPQATVRFAEAESSIVGLDDLGQYVTERSNPDNVRHVTRIEVELPSGILKDGVSFVDTPGLGSLARYGEMESLAYLPRCDLGIVLVDASSTLTAEDTAVVSALRQAGAEVMVLLAKADVLAADEQATAAQYAESQLRLNLGFDVPVYAVSVKEASVELCDRWFESVLLPSLRKHRELTHASLRRKVGLLREATVAALRRQLDKTCQTDVGSARQRADMEAALIEAAAQLDAAQRQRPEWQETSEKALDSAAQEIAGRWCSGDATRIDGAATVAIHAVEQAKRLAEPVVASLLSLREKAGGALQRAAAVAGSSHEDAAELPVVGGMPLLDVASGPGDTSIRRPWWAGLSRTLAYRRAYAGLNDQFGPWLSAQLEQYVKVLGRWRSEALARLRRSFAAKADFYRAQCGQAQETLDLAAAEDDLKRLEALGPVDAVDTRAVQP